MTEGPIQFASDGPKDRKGPTEFGGRAGLIQGGVEPGEVHELTASEMRGIIVRAEPARVVDPVSGLYTLDESLAATDPLTDREVDPAWNEDGANAKPVDAPPRTGDPRAAEL